MKNRKIYIGKYKLLKEPFTNYTICSGNKIIAQSKSNSAKVYNTMLLMSQSVTTYDLLKESKDLLKIIHESGLVRGEKTNADIKLKIDSYQKHIDFIKSNMI